MTASIGTAISLRGLRKQYTEGDRAHVVLDDVEAEILEGETVALKGRSGSGKSTLLNLIAGIDAPDAGKIVVAGTLVLSTRHSISSRRSMSRTICGSCWS